MIKTLLAQLKQYRSASILAPVFTVGEVLMEVLIPFVTASIIDKGIEAGNIQQVYFYGGIMLAMAFLSLAFGVLAGKYAAKASSGFACNLRDGIYEKVQSFAFSNIDKYSTAGLVTRMTTDVTNLQNAYQMILRIAVRAPDADLQHVHVLLHQREIKHDLSGGYRCAGCRIGFHYGPHHPRIYPGVS